MKAVLAAVALLAWSSSASAVNPSLDVSQYGHTAWKTRDGFAGGVISALAQTSDGYLWLGTDRGLFRFDGMRAVSWQPRDHGLQELPSEVVTSLVGARDGTLWIGTTRGVARWNGRTLTRYDQLSGRIGPMLEDRDGVVWIANLDPQGRWTRPCRAARERLQCDGPDISILRLFEDARGSIWGRAVSGEVWRLKPEPRVLFASAREDAEAGALSEDEDGALLIARTGGVARLVDGRVDMKFQLPARIPSTPAGSLLRDNDGGLWIGTSASGLVHLHQGITDMYTEAEGLSGDAIHAFFQDREGSVWVATTGGLDRFRDVAAAAVTVRQGLSNARIISVAAAADGSVWAAGVGALHNIRGNGVTIYRERKGAAVPIAIPLSSRTVREVAAAWADRLTATFQDRKGQTWVAAHASVGRIDADRFVPIDGLPGEFTRAIVEDRDQLWIANDQHGLFTVSSDGRDITSIPRSSLRHQDGITAAAADPNRTGIWLGFFNGGIVFFDRGGVQASFEASQGLGGGTVRQLVLDRDSAIWVATEGGLSRVKDGRVATLTQRDGLPCDTILWMVQADDGALWISTRCGLIRIARDEIDRWIEYRNGVHVSTFDSSDGVRTYASLFPFTNPAVKSADGRLWFTSPEGLGVIDPHYLSVNTRPPPVSIERVTADRSDFDIPPGVGAALRLHPRVRDLQIDYTALSLVAPERNQFRYELEGYDGSWQEVGNRRQAFYTNLPPGAYRFRVIASNNSGVWNEAGAALEFTIPPAYYQTFWFRALTATMGVMLVWALHRVRLRIVERHQSEISALNERLMKAQEQERIRIAGELHDGVMQQMLAVTMMLGSAKRKIAWNAADAEASIDKIQQKVIQAGDDIRQLSHGLHPPLLQNEGLPGALRAYCEQFSTASGIPVACDADESARDLSRGAALALFRITQEALGNAAKHASAKHVSVRLARSDGTITLRVADDGVGFDRARLGRSGGLGLVMMRERAGQLNGTFEFDSTPGRGMAIAVEIPFR